MMYRPLRATNVVAFLIGIAVVAFLGGGHIDVVTLLLMAAVVLLAVLFGRLMRWLEGGR